MSKIYKDTYSVLRAPIPSINGEAPINIPIATTNLYYFDLFLSSLTFIH